MSTFMLEIVTPERKVYEDQVDMIVVRGVAGELGILPHHVPLVTPLKIAPLQIKKGNTREEVAISGGFVEVRKDKVVVLAESAELPGEIDLDRAKAAKARAERRLQAKQGDLDHMRAEMALQRAITRIQVGEFKP